MGGFTRISNPQNIVSRTVDFRPEEFFWTRTISTLVTDIRIEGDQPVNTKLSGPLHHRVMASLIGPPHTLRLLDRALCYEAVLLTATATGLLPACVFHDTVQVTPFARTDSDMSSTVQDDRLGSAAALIVLLKGRARTSKLTLAPVSLTCDVNMTATLDDLHSWLVMHFRSTALM